MMTIVLADITPGRALELLRTRNFEGALCVCVCASARPATARQPLTHLLTDPPTH